MRCAAPRRAAPAVVARSALHKPVLTRPPLRRMTTSTPEDEFDNPIAGEVRRFPKKKVAMLVAYIGTNFSGLQRNPGVHTVEDTLEAAIFQAGGILPANLGRLQNVGWRRSGRTDKGVHSIGNILVMKMQLRPGEPIEALRQRINSFLPSEVRILGMERTTRSFTPRHPSAREYHYLLPVEAFTYNCHLNLDKCFSRMRELLSMFTGTNNFHNYTNRRMPLDPSCRRFILSSTIDEPANSFYRVRIVGQSFMNHQIRKMIGAAVAVIRQDAPLSVIPASFAPPMQWLPTAPPGFLIKMKSDYSFYNKKWAGTHNGMYVRASLEFPQAAEESKAFEEKLLTHIRLLNEATHPFPAWLDTELREPVRFDKILAGEPTRTLKGVGEQAGDADEDVNDDDSDDFDDSNDSAAESRDALPPKRPPTLA